MNGLVNVNLTAWEKLYGLSGRQISFIPATYDLFAGKIKIACQLSARQPYIITYLCALLCFLHVQYMYVNRRHYLCRPTFHFQCFSLCYLAISGSLFTMGAFWRGVRWPLRWRHSSWRFLTFCPTRTSSDQSLWKLVWQQV